MRPGPAGTRWSAPLAKSGSTVKSSPLLRQVERIAESFNEPPDQPVADTGAVSSHGRTSSEIPTWSRSHQVGDTPPGDAPISDVALVTLDKS